MADETKQVVTKASIVLTHDQLAEILHDFRDWPREEWPEAIALLVDPTVVKVGEWALDSNSSHLLHWDKQF